MNDALATQLAGGRARPAVKCIVLTGAGKGFCAGGDVKGMAAHAATARSATTPSTARSTGSASTSAPRPASCSRCPSRRSPRLPGAAAGAGLSLALACDLRIMASTAIMTTAFARVGFSGDYGGTYFLTQLVGSAKARELYFLSDRVERRRGAAPRPDQLGRASPTSWPPRRARSPAAWPQGPTVAYRYMKENLNRAMAGDVDDCLDLEATHHIHCGQTEDHREAAKAFVEKREPVFKGR